MIGFSLMPLSFKQSVGTTGILHGFGHIVVFAITAILFCCCGDKGTVRILIAGAVILFGAGLEFLQWAIYGSTFEWSDVRTDSVGSFLGLLLVCASFNKKVCG